MEKWISVEIYMFLAISVDLHNQILSSIIKNYEVCWSILLLHNFFEKNNLMKVIKLRNWDTIQKPIE